MGVHGGGCPEIDFGGAASRGGGELVEPKVCEGCTRQFFRSMLPVMRLREKLCPECRRQRDKLAEMQQRAMRD